MKYVKFLFLLLIMTSCSKEVYEEENFQDVPVVVHNYSFDTKINNFTMPDIPKGYENLPELKEWQAKGNDCKVSGNKTMGFQNLGQNVYVTGKWTITGTYGNSSAKIWVLPGATLEFTGSGFEAGAGHITIYNYGTLSFNNDNQCRLGGNLTVYSQTAIDKIPNLNLACEFSTNSSIKVNRIHFNNSANVWLGCKLEASEEVIFDNEANFSVGYIKSPKITLKAKPTVVIRDNGYIETDLLSIENAETSKIYSDGIAVIKAKSIRVNNGANLKGTFGNVSILCEDCEKFTFNSSVNLDADIEFTNDECNPIRIKDDKPSLETLGTVENKHTHPISATCIQFDDNKAYVSWHEKGKGIHGCIEMIELNGDEVRLLSYIEDKNTDFNHLILDRGRLLVAGHNANHAVVGEVTQTGIKYSKLKGGDVNCIIRNNDYLYAATYGGLHTLNSDLTSINFIPTTGSAKHLAITNGKILELNLTTRDKTSSSAELKLFEQDWKNPITITSDLTITPVDGKNVIAADESAYYVCLGHNGVKKYVGNTCVATIKEGPANGICIDDKYLYVAFGKGLYIYNKNDLSKPILKYKHKLASCNYVAVNGNLIYLAYGRYGYDVIRIR